MIRRGAIFSILVFLAGLTFFREAEIGVFRGLEECWKGWLTHAASPTKDPAPVFLVDLKGQSPEKTWGPEDYALIFETALSFQPEVLVVEPALSFDGAESDGQQRQSMFERMLQERILRAPKLVLGGQLGWATDAQTVPEIQPMPVLRNVKGDVRKIADYVVVEKWAREEYRQTTVPGWTNLMGKEQDRCPLLLRYRGQPVPGIVLQAIMLWEKATPDDVVVELGKSIKVGTVTIPIADDGSMQINSGAFFPRATSEDLVLARQQIDNKATPQISPEWLKGKMFFVSDPNKTQWASLKRGDSRTHAEYFAAAIATIQKRAFIGETPSAVRWLLISLATFMALTIPKWRISRSALGLVLFGGIYAGLAWWIFRTFLVLLPGVGVFALLFVMFAIRVVRPKLERVFAF